MSWTKLNINDILIAEWGEWAIVRINERDSHVVIDHTVVSEKHYGHHNNKHTFPTTCINYQELIFTCDECGEKVPSDIFTRLKLCGLYLYL